MEAAHTREYVDKRYEDRHVNELPDVPVEALRGLGKRGGEALDKAFGVKTIRDLATNDFVLKAQEVLRLAEGPAAIPTVASTWADATDKERVRIGNEVVRDQTHVFEPVRMERIQVEQPDQGR